jgi:putative peptidoglycan lipid II flippase
VNLLVTTSLASYIAGGVSSLDYAWRVFTMPQVVIAQGLAIVALPAFAALIAEGNMGQLQERLGDSLRGLLFLALPAAAGLMLLAGPIVAMLFQRGEFGAESTQLVATALAFLALGLVGHSMVEVLSRAFYALPDTRTPVLVAGYTVLLNIALSLVLGLGFLRLGWEPLGGLALATSVAVTVEMVVLVRLLHQRLGGVAPPGVMRPAVGRMLVATGTMALGLVLWRWATAGWPAWIVALGGVVLGLLVYGAAAWALGSREARAFARALPIRRGRPPRRRFDPPTP